MITEINETTKTEEQERAEKLARESSTSVQAAKKLMERMTLRRRSVTRSKRDTVYQRCQ